MTIPRQSRTLLGLLAVVLGLLATSRSGAVVIADSVADFSNAQSEKNWYYGYYPGPFNSSAFVQMPTFSGGLWTNGAMWTRHFAQGGHPNGPLNRPEQWAVRRWISPIASPLFISGVIADLGPSGGDGVLAQIFVDGVAVLRKNINNGQTSDFAFAVPIYAAVGTRVDFAIAPKGTDTSDSTRFRTVISNADPGPGSGNQIFWAGDQATCDGVYSPPVASFHAGTYWLNYFPPGSGNEAIFDTVLPSPLGPPQGNYGLNPHQILFGDVLRRAFLGCPNDAFTPGGPATVGTMLFKSGSWDFYFRSETGPPDTARLTVTGLTRIGTSANGASLALHAGTMTSGPVIVFGPLSFGPKRPSSFLRIANDAILVSPSVTVARGGLLSGRGRVRGTVFLSGGKIAPGESPGTLTVEGDLYVNAESELELEVGGLAPGESYDQLIVDGETVLEGTVRISFTDGFAPQVGDSFTFFGPSGFDASAATIVTDPGVTIAEFGSPGSQTLEVVAIPTPAADYQQWRQAKFGSTTSRDGEPTANLDGDEAQNFTEFLFNLDPNAPDYHSVEAGAGSSGFPVALVVQAGGVQRAAFEFIRHKRFGPYVVESSADLETWTPETPVVDSVVSVSDDYERVRVLDVFLPQEGAANRRFLRISVAR